MAISTGAAIPPESQRTPTTEERLSALGLDGRRRMVHRLLPLETGSGLEIAPNWAPVVTKSEGDVLYCDYLTYDQLLERERTNPGRIQHGLRVQRLDFIWEIGKTLQECAGPPRPSTMSFRAMSSSTCRTSSSISTRSGPSLRTMA